MIGFVWTDEAIEHLLKCWRGEKTAAECAALLMEAHGGTLTRNSILGKVFRLGLSRRDGETRARKAYKARQARVEKAAEKKPKRERAKKPKPEPAVVIRSAPEPKPIPAIVVQPDRPTLFSIGALCCRFPLWPNGPAPRPQQAFVCGAPVAVVRGDPKPYCLEHSLRCWSQEEAKTRAVKAEKKRSQGAGDRVFKAVEAA
jgi:hypothetical protein